jgi:transporter family-2 protein
MQTVVYISIAFFLGVLMSIYLPMNSSVSRYVGSPVTANVTFFLTALLTSILIFFINGQFDTLTKT